MSALKIDDMHSDYLLRRLSAWYEFISPLLPLPDVDLTKSFYHYLKVTGFPDDLSEVSVMYGEGCIHTTVITVAEGPRSSRTMKATLPLEQFSYRRKLNEDPEKISDSFFTDVVLAAKGHYKIEGVTSCELVVATYYHHYGILRSLECTRFTVLSFMSILRREMMMRGYAFTPTDEINMLLTAVTENLGRVMDYVISYLALLQCTVKDGVTQFVKPNPLTHQELEKIVNKSKATEA